MMERLLLTALVAWTCWTWRGVVHHRPVRTAADHRHAPAGVMPARVLAIEVRGNRVFAEYEVKTAGVSKLKNLQVAVMAENGAQTHVGRQPAARVLGKRTFRGQRGSYSSGNYTAQVVSSRDGFKYVAMSDPVDFVVP